MYRLLRQQDAVHERRHQRQPSTYAKPELLRGPAGRAPNQLWSWDITKLRGPTAWLSYYLDVMLDVSGAPWARSVVGWLLADQESAALAQPLIAESCHKPGIEPGQLTIHADRGAPMTAKTVAQLLIDLGVIQSHSPPYTADDGPLGAFLRSAVQDYKVSLRLSGGPLGAFYGSGRRSPVGENLLCLVQQRASSYRSGLDDPGDGPLWSS